MKLPEQLEPFRNRKIWVCYVRAQKKTGLYTKPPVDPHTLGNASSTNTATWATFDEAAAQIGKVATVYLYDEKRNVDAIIEGVGINLENTELLGVDMDHVITRDEQGKFISVTDEAKALWHRLDSYTEISPSGTGVHVLVIAKNSNPELNKNGYPKGLKIKNNDGTDFELYDNGRYFTVTGNALTGCKGIEERQEVVDQIIKEWNKARETARLASFSTVVSSNRERVEVNESDADLWQKAFNNGYRGHMIRRLYDGDYSDSNGDRSRGDYVLMKDLAYWTNGDLDRMITMFRQSNAGKRDDGHYIETTAKRALDGFRSYTGYSDEEKKAYAKKKELEELAAWQKEHKGSFREYQEEKRKRGL